MEAEIINFNELKWLKLNFGRALVNDDVYKEWRMIQQEQFDEVLFEIQCYIDNLDETRYLLKTV